MSKLDELKSNLEPGKVYRREDLARYTTSVDRHLEELTTDGTLKKLSGGMYYFPRKTAFGEAPPDDDVLVRSFLKDHRFLVTSPNSYNKLGMGTTQLYNTRVVYNRKRNGTYTFGNRTFRFLIKPDFPLQETAEFLVVDLVNNLNNLAEDPEAVLSHLPAKAAGMDKSALTQAVTLYGSGSTKKIFAPYVNP